MPNVKKSYYFSFAGILNTYFISEKDGRNAEVIFTRAIGAKKMRSNYLGAKSRKSINNNLE